ncbi:hypothetical protein [Mangrovimonas sp. ST2L15]|uniref:hypothetical protein n=1 Tax=Mangrovimonas sp. ST2L15 TaxID=1645916 RepID=UPI0006B49F9B|nr:hypothetical protein [Mangrovimonas sp. ST2L15]
MKLIFNKEENNEITVKIQQGTVAIDFTYSEMIKQLLQNNSVEDTEFNNMTEEEEESLKKMLNEVSEIFVEEEPDEGEEEK